MKAFGKVVLGFFFLLLLQGIHCIQFNDFNINQDANYTNSASVTLYISANDVNKMSFSCDNSTWSAWIDYSTTTSFNLETSAGCSAGDGTKTVYAKIWNIDTNTQNTKSDTIILDTDVNIVSVWHDANSIDSNSLLGPGDTLTVIAIGETDCNVTYSIGSTITDQNLFDDGLHGDGAAGDGTYGGTYNVSAGAKSSNGKVYLVATFTDRAGNTESKNSFTKLAIDVNEPVLSSKSPANYVRSQKPTISADVLDYASGVNATTIALYVNSSLVPDANYSRTAITNGYRLTYTPDSNLSGTTIDVNINALDNVGNDGNFHWQFSIDLNAPTAVSDLNAKPISDTNDINISFSATTDIGSGVTAYYLYRSTSTLSNSTATQSKKIATISPSDFMTYTDSPGSSFEGETLYYVVRAIDGAGNISNISNNASVKVEDVTPPTDINVSLAYYVNSSMPSINISGSDIASVRLSCNDVNYSNGFSSFPITSFNLKAAPYCTTSDGNKTLYVWVFDNADNNVKVSRSVFVDVVSPSAPTNITTTLNENTKKINIKWNTSTDSGSGVSYYYLYYEKDASVTNFSPKIKTTDTNYAFSYSKRGKYCFKIRAVDLAGNYSDFSEEKCQASDLSIPILSISLSGGKDVNGLLYFGRDSKLTISVSSSTELKSINGWIQQNDANRVDLNFTGSKSAFTAEYSVINGFDGNAKVHIQAIDTLDLNSEANASFFVDSVKPLIKSLDLNQFKEEMLKITAEFNKDTKKARFYYKNKNKWELLKEFNITPNNLAALYDFNLSTIPDLNIGIMAEAVDLAGNKRQKIQLIKLPRGVLKELTEAAEKKEKIKSIYNELIEWFLPPTNEFSEKYSEALSQYNKAKEEYNKGDFNGSLEKINNLNKAVEWLEENKPVIKKEKIQEIDYEKNKLVFGNALKEYLSGEALKSSQSLWNKLSFSRRTELIEMQDQQGKHFQIVSFLTIKNPSNEKLEGIKIVEIIPKSLAQKSSEIKSNTIFKVILEDPAIMFTVPELNAGESIEFKYAPKKLMDETKARQLYSNLMNEFYLPVPVASIEDAKKIVIPYRGINPLAIVFIIAFIAIAFLIIRKRGFK